MKIITKKYNLRCVKVKPIKKLVGYLVKCPLCNKERRTWANPFRCGYCMEYYYIDTDKMTKCPRCNGKGKYATRVGWRECRNCKGIGKV